MAHMILISQPFDPVEPHLGAGELPVIATHVVYAVKATVVYLSSLLYAETPPMQLQHLITSIHKTVLTI